MSSGRRCIWPFIFMMFASGLFFRAHGSTTNTQRRLLQTTGMFCVASPSADPRALQAGLNWACGPGGANCVPIQPGQPCYVANNLPLTTSWAYNDYYQKNRANGATCSFGNTAGLTNTDPSHDSCKFPSSNSGTPTVSAPTVSAPPPPFNSGSTPPPPFNFTFAPPPPFNSILAPPPPPGLFPASPPFAFDNLSSSLTSMKALMLAFVVSVISSFSMYL